MISNLKKYKEDLEKLIAQGEVLYCQVQLRDDAIFHSHYQDWYSESLVLLKQLMPDRLNDFIKFYRSTKIIRSVIEHEYYTIEDYLNGIVYAGEAAIVKFKQQLHIIDSIQRRFESSLFDIKQLVQANLFDSELEAAAELNKKGFTRGAGAIAGVVLENHLLQVCENHKIKIEKKNSSINDLADLLKNREVIEISVLRNIQYLADLRNLCSHKKTDDPSSEDVGKLIKGVSEAIKTLF